MTQAIATYAIDRSGNLHVGRVNLTRLRRVSPDLRKEVEGYVMEVQQSLEAMTVPLPNRVVNYGASWQAQRTLPIDSPTRRESGVMEMTYTYLGCRKRGGRDEAVIALRGRIRSSGRRQAIIGGKANGTALIDLQSGQVTLARASLAVDMEARLEEGKKIKMVCAMDVEMKRTLFARP